MSQLTILVGVILIYFLYKALRKKDFSWSHVAKNENPKRPKDHLSVLYKETVGLASLQENPILFLSDAIESENDAEAYSHHVVQEILEYLDLPYSSIRINYSVKNDPPKVTMNSIHGFDFQIPADLKQSKGALQSLLAYECVRIFMAYQRSEFALRVKEHHLNDYAAIYSGLGVIFLKHLEELLDLLRHIEPEFSFYTNINDLMFVMAVYLFQKDLTPDYLQGRLDTYYTRRITREYRQLIKTPYEIIYKDAFDANIRCHKCFQISRVPAGRKMVVTCPNCKNQFDIRT
ncbi:MAG: hypothetical protein B6244_01540 [Candidatus Cloacimonetes bacterium 4572_55]|nr:MAG: hypothetical protein B6244_01540 [Candidatus Cloacimonetes bacterium 4572_55]